MITKEHVVDAQQKWGNGVVKIGALKDSRSECEGFCKRISRPSLRF